MMIVGRNAEKSAAVAKSYELEWTITSGLVVHDYSGAGRSAYTVFFDAAATRPAPGRAGGTGHRRRKHISMRESRLALTATRDESCAGDEGRAG